MIDLQNKIHAWVVRCFGQKAANSRTERALRLLEEAVEFAQAVGLAEEQAHAQIRDTYSRPIGKPEVEIAQVGLCLLAAASAMDIDLEGAIKTEIARISARPDSYYRDRWSRKLKG